MLVDPLPALMWQQGVAEEHRQRVMVIAHDNNLKNILSYALECYGFKAIFCDNCDEAMLSSSIGAFDYIIADFDVPGPHMHMHGPEIIRMLRDRFPVAIIIGMSKKERGMEFLRAGANDFLRIPFAPYLLIMMLCGTDMLEQV